MYARYRSWWRVPQRVKRIGLFMNQTNHNTDVLEAPAVVAVAAPQEKPENKSNFDSFQLPPALKASLTKMKFTSPTPIQEQAIPIALEGKDVMGTAQTGTGKTGAFAIPIVAKLLASPRGSAMVMLPTRELATQVIDVVHQLLGANSPIKTALLIGGESMPKQFSQLRARPRIIVGTPGRINDHLERGTLLLHDTGLLVLDETDRMLDMGFGVQIDKIIKFLPPVRQTLMFSATLPPEILKMSERYLKNPARIAVGNANVVAKKVIQEHIHVSTENKLNELLKQLEARQGSIIVFMKTKFGAEKMARKLSNMKHSADAIHGDLQQRQRDRVIAGFREKRYRILVATDIAARGLDIPHIEHVINYDLPQMPEDYIHRLGRTARADAEGSAISFISGEDALKWRAIQRLLNPDAPQEKGGNRDYKGGGGGKNNNRKRPFRRFGNKPKAA